MGYVEWKKVQLGDIVDTISVTHKLDKNVVVLINTSDVLDGKVLNHNYVENKNLRGQFKKSFKKDDILYSEIRPQNRRFAFIDFDAKDYVASTRLMVLRKKSDNISPQFLFQLLKSKDVIRNLQMIAESRSGTFPQITYTELANLEIFLPPFQEQQSIAEMLSGLDDKIELNNRINKTLEEIAQAIFKQWFVDFDFPDENGQPYKSSGGEMEESELGLIPKGWKVGLLSDIAFITMGQSPSGSSYNESGDGSVFYQGRAEFGTRFPTRRLFTTEPKRMAIKGDVLMSVRAPVGDINVAIESCCIGRGLAAIQSKYGYSSFLLYTLLSLKKQLDVFNGEGTVFGSINKQSLNELRVIIPIDDVIKSFEDIVKPMDIMFENNYKVLSNLQSIRDSLLPKLMSGEIRVPVEEVPQSV